MLVTNAIYQKFPNATAKDLNAARGLILNNQYLTKIASALGVSQLQLYNNTVACDLIKCIVGALYFEVSSLHNSLNNK
jgi:dsRNA-specific ribonuclease